MDADERAKMEAMGYAVVDDAADWLELTEVERQIVDLRIRLLNPLKLPPCAKPIGSGPKSGRRFPGSGSSAPGSSSRQ
jgi:hypothetical protein